MNVLQALSSALEDNDAVGIAHALDSHKAWTEAVDAFQRRLASRFEGFKDIWHPLDGAIHQLRHGLGVLSMAAGTTAAQQTSEVSASASGSGVGDAATCTALSSLVTYPLDVNAAAPAPSAAVATAESAVSLLHIVDPVLQLARGLQESDSDVTNSGDKAVVASLCTSLVLCGLARLRLWQLVVNGVRVSGSAGSAVAGSVGMSRACAADLLAVVHRAWASAEEAAAARRAADAAAAAALQQNGVDFKPQFALDDDIASPEAMFGRHHAHFEAVVAARDEDGDLIDPTAGGDSAGGNAGGNADGVAGDGLRLQVNSMSPADLDLVCDVHAVAFGGRSGAAPSSGSASGSVATAAGQVDVEAARRDVLARSQAAAKLWLRAHVTACDVAGHLFVAPATAVGGNSGSGNNSDGVVAHVLANVLELKAAGSATSAASATLQDAMATNVTEVMVLGPPLASLMARIHSLLVQFPDNAVLQVGTAPFAIACIWQFPFLAGPLNVGGCYGFTAPFSLL